MGNSNDSTLVGEKNTIACSPGYCTKVNSLEILSSTDTADKSCHQRPEEGAGIDFGNFSRSLDSVLGTPQAGALQDTEMCGAEPARQGLSSLLQLFGSGAAEGGRDLQENSCHRDDEHSCTQSIAVTGDTTGTTNPAQPADTATDSTNPAQPSDTTTGSVNPAQPSDTTTDSTNPAEPSDTTGTTNPAQPGDTTASTTPPPPPDNTTAGGTAALGWGIDAHPDGWGGAYASVSPTQIMEDAKQLGASYIETNFTGDATYETEMIQAAQQAGMSLVAQIPGGDVSNMSYSEAYSYAQQIAEQVGAAGGADVVKFVQAGNEEDSAPQSEWAGDAQGIAGLEDGWRSVLPNTLIGPGITCEASGQQFLQYLQSNGISFSAVGLHAYVPDGGDTSLSGMATNPDGIAQQFPGMPIVVNEFGSAEPVDTNQSPATIGNLMLSISENAQRTNIIGASIYEMFQDPGSPDGYGILNSDGTPNPQGQAFADGTASDNFA